MFLSKNRLLSALLFFFGLLSIQAQGQGSFSGAAGETDPVSFVGMTLEELVRRFGVPGSVYPVRGLEEWQDDVVFAYDQGDFYVYKDRIWQVGLKEVRGIKIGDSRGVVSLVLGSAPGLSGAEVRGNSVFYSLDEAAWPLMLRMDFDDADKVRAIFIYRTDF